MAITLDKMQKEREGQQLVIVDCCETGTYVVWVPPTRAGLRSPLYRRVCSSDKQRYRLVTWSTGTAESPVQTRVFFR
eukprot:1599348-Pyramimonas_sp.AAC.1